MRKIDGKLAAYSVGRISLLTYFPSDEGARGQLAAEFMKHVDREELDDFINLLVEQPQWEGLPQFHEVLERLRSRRKERPNPACVSCSGVGWISVERKDRLPASKRCSCWGTPSTQPQIAAPEVEKLPEPPLDDEEHAWIQQMDAKIKAMTAR